MYHKVKLKNKLWYHFKNHKWVVTELGPYNEISNNIIIKHIKNTSICFYRNDL